jgi:hypothetical protein
MTIVEVNEISTIKAKNIRITKHKAGILITFITEGGQEISVESSSFSEITVS